MLLHHNPFFPKHTFAFKGGSDPGKPTTYAPPAPPTAANAAAVQAGADARSHAAEKQGLTSTLLGNSKEPKNPWDGTINTGTNTANTSGGGALLGDTAGGNFLYGTEGVMKQANIKDSAKGSTAVSTLLGAPVVGPIGGSVGKALKKLF